LSEKDLSELLGKLNQSGRERVTRFVLNSAFVEPVVASFPLDGRMGTARSLASAGNACDPLPEELDTIGNA
jgi:hypothetical protein